MSLGRPTSHFENLCFRAQHQWWWAPQISATLPLIQAEGHFNVSMAVKNDSVRLPCITEHWQWDSLPNENIMWHTDLNNISQNLLMRQDFASVMLFSCDLLSWWKSLIDETLSVMPLLEWSYISCLVSMWLMDSKGHGGRDIKPCSVQSIWIFFYKPVCVCLCW